MKKIWYVGFLLAVFLGVGCGLPEQKTIKESQTISWEAEQNAQKEKTGRAVELGEEKGEEPSLDLEEIPQYKNKAYITLNDNVPCFSEEELTTEAFENYSSLDALGRCGEAYANVCMELMPTQERESISRVKPSGWQTVKYDVVDGRYLYNRCHLIGYQLAGENANEKNLITGTRYMNMEGMLPFEDEVADYVKKTKHHVLYRVTPEYEGDNLVADGVQMEAYSVEDHGAGICFHVFVYNAQPGIVIDYTDGSSRLAKNAKEQVKAAKEEKATEKEEKKGASQSLYVVNTNTGKFHEPSCSSAKKIAKKHRLDLQDSRQSLIDQGYEPCGLCNP